MSPEPPDVSVVIVTYNSEHEIRACLRGLISNNDSHTLQIHIIDNASSDNVINIIEGLISRPINDRYEILITKNQTNRGFTSALNQGLERCDGDYILVLNPDASLRDGCLAQLIAVVEKEPGVGVVAPQLLSIDGIIQPSCRRFPRRRDLVYELLGLSYLFPNSQRFNDWKMADFTHRQRCDVEQPQGACLLFSKKILKDVGFWDEGFPMFFSDVDWCVRVKQNGYKIIYYPPAKVDHKKGASIYRNRVKMIISSHKSFSRYLKKYRPNFILVNHIFAIILGGAAFIRILLFMATVLFSKRNLEAQNEE